VNGIRVRVIPLQSHVVGDVVDRDHPVGKDQDDEEKDGECEIAQKVHGGKLLSVKYSKVQDISGQQQCFMRWSIATQ
jgi:hypothetical protein